MTLSQSGLQAALASWSDEIFLECLTIEHPDISDILLVNDNQDLTRSAGTFIAFPFTARLHARADDRTIDAEIVCDNVDQRIVQALRGISNGATVTYEVVLRSTPNVVEQGPLLFKFDGMVADMATVSVRISYGLGFLNEAFPKDYFAPWNVG